MLESDLIVSLISVSVCNEGNLLRLFSLLFGQENCEDYGINWEGPLPDEEYDGPLSSNDDLVEVLAMFSLPREKLELLKEAIDPLQQSDSYGIDIYLKTVAFVERFMHD